MEHLYKRIITGTSAPLQLNGKIKNSKELAAEFEKYEESVKEYYLQKALYDAFENGVQKGISTGKMEGLYEGEIKFSFRTKMEIAKNLLELKLSLDDIKKATGLNEKEIAQLYE